MRESAGRRSGRRRAARAGWLLGTLLFVGAGPAGPSGQDRVLAPCDAPDVAPWVTRLRDRVLSFDRLALHAVELYGPPVTCEGAVTSEFDGVEFGVVRLGFAGGAWFEIETLPPEASIAILRSPAGFPDEDEARRVLAAYCDEVGVEIDWTVPATATDGVERIEAYTDPDDGLNASASFVFRDDTLIGLRLSLSL